MIKIDILTRSKRKSIQLSINQLGLVTVRAPLKLNIQHIQNFVDSKQEWVIAQQQKIFIKNFANKNIVGYTHMLLWGREYPICFDDTAKTHQIIGERCVIPAKYRTNFMRKLVLWYRYLSLEHLFSKLNTYSKIMNLYPLDYKLTNAKTCWGTCNSKKIISLNWRLIMVPEPAIDYVIVHELSHLLQMNHSKKFWAIVESILPDYKQRKNILKQYDYLLNLYR